MSENQTNQPLNADELERLVGRLPGWTVRESSLVKTFSFDAYLDGIAFVNRLAQEAEKMNHHPDLQVGWRKVTVTLSTHSAGAVTGLDAQLAEKAEALQN